MNHKSRLILNSCLIVILALVGPFSFARAQGNSAAPAGLAGTVYTVQDLGTLTGGSTYARAVNNSGMVTGWSTTGAGNAFEQAFKWQSGVLTPLPVLGGTPALSIGYSLNASGQVAGYSSSADTSSRAVRWAGGGVTDLGTLGGRRAAVLHINEAGQMVGWAEFDMDSQERHAAIWTSAGVISTLAAAGNYNAAWSINAAGTAVGECGTVSTTSVIQPCAWPGGLLPALGGTQGSARDINDAGAIVGWAETAQIDHLGGHIPHAALWDVKGVVDLGALPGNKVSRANAINFLGQVVGAASIINELASSPTHAVLWENGAINDLNDRLPAGSGWVLSEAYGINAEGQIVGIGGHNGDYYRAFLLTPATRPFVTLDGAGAGLVGQTYTYTATVGPAALEQPITYTWAATNQSTVIESGGLTSTHTFNWASTGPQEVSLTVASALGAASTVLHSTDIGDVLVSPAAGSPAEITYTFALGRTVTITIPPDTVAAGTELLFTALPQPAASGGYSLNGIAFTLNAYVGGLRQPGFVFNQPVTVALTFTAGDVSGLDESALALYYQSGTVWIDAASTCQPASLYARDLVNHHLSVNVCHLSTFAAGIFNGTRIFLPVVMINYQASALVRK